MGGWGDDRCCALASCSRCDAPLSSAPCWRSSALLDAMVSSAFSMLSLRPRRSENQQSTSSLDSLVSWASWSAAEHTHTQGQRVTPATWQWEGGGLGIHSPCRELLNWAHLRHLCYSCHTGAHWRQARSSIGVRKSRVARYGRGKNTNREKGTTTDADLGSLLIWKTEQDEKTSKTDSYVEL